MFALADCNNFYCSCERIFRPALRNKPVIVLSNNDGCAIARSEEAKALGIKMGTPEFMIRDLVKEHDVQMFSSNYTLYGDISRRVVEIYRQYAKEIEVYSIDESFLYLFNYVFTDLFEYGKEIRSKVMQWVGIPICIGMGASKSLAKAANKYAKKKYREVGVFVIDSEEKRKEVLQWLPIDDIWGVGRQYSKWLIANGIQTAYDFSLCNEEWVRQKMGVVGVRLLHELNGISCLELEEVAPAKKAICCSRSFRRLLTDKTDIAEAISTFATRACEKLRKEHLCASVVQVFAHTNPHRLQDKQYHGNISIPMLTPTQYTGDVIKYALKGLDAIFRPGINYLKGGVMLLGMVPENQVQQSLFTGHQKGLLKGEQVAKALDRINNRFGQDQVRYAAAGYNKGWKLKNDYISPCYTTNFKDLPRVQVGR